MDHSCNSSKRKQQWFNTKVVGQNGFLSSEIDSTVNSTVLKAFNKGIVVLDVTGMGPTSMRRLFWQYRVEDGVTLVVLNSILGSVVASVAIKVMK